MCVRFRKMTGFERAVPSIISRFSLSFSFREVRLIGKVTHNRVHARARDLANFLAATINRVHIVTSEVAIGRSFNGASSTDVY